MSEQVELATNRGNELSSEHDELVTFASIEDYPLVTIEIKLLVFKGSPRLAGEDPNHTRALAEVEDVLPPIIVHRPTMKVIDGMHRVRAALLNNQSLIRARMVDCDESTAFVLAVTANIAHGLPLSPADRKAAAANIISTHPKWSDRAVAASTGLSDKTVSAIRVSSTADSPQSNSRLGRDGRVRPLNSATMRRQAAAMIVEQPRAGVREIARATGLSPATVRDVRTRTDKGEDPVPLRYRDGGPPAPSMPADRSTVRPKQAELPVDHENLLAKLHSDPSLRLTEGGRFALRWLHMHAVDAENCRKLGENVPDHWAARVGGLARHCAAAWLLLAEQLERRSAEISDSTTGPPPR